MAKNIAIVEDDPDQRSNYVDAITKKGYDVVAYSSRQEALSGFERELPDLAILDIILGDREDLSDHHSAVFEDHLVLGDGESDDQYQGR